MRLGVKILIPQVLLLVLLGAACALLVLDIGWQQSALQRSRQHLQATSALVESLERAYSETALEVLSYRMDRRPRRIEAILGAEEGARKTIEAYRGLLIDPLERQLLLGLADGRQQVIASRGDLIRAIEAGAEGGIQAAFERWRIHRAVSSAHVDDLAAFNVNRFEKSLEAVEQDRLRLARNLLLGLLLGCALVAASFLYAWRTMSRPLGHLAASIEAFGRGKLDVRLGQDMQQRSDEIGTVAAAFNAMAGQIEELNRTLEQRVHERTLQLEAANKELEAFAYSVSHDLRAPLRAIDGFSQALLEDYDARLDEDGKDSLRRVRDASQRMAQLIDDMLKLSRATRGELDIEPVDLSAIAQRIADELRSAAPERDVAVSIAPGVRARGDARLLGSVLENLLSNAWKFTGRKRGARIAFDAQRKAGQVECRVSDDGAGFDMAFAASLFTPFQRLHRASEFPGNGIGLATVKRIVARLGGTVRAEGAVDRGASFYFTLPDVS